MTTVLVTGGGGFIAGHLVRALLDRGDDVRAADMKPLAEWKQVHPEARNLDRRDLSAYDDALAAAYGADEIYHLAAEAGGMGFISTHKADCTLSVLADAQVLRAARANGAQIFYASSACIYPLHLQETLDAPDLAEHMAYPPEPEEAYGWEKLYAERMYLAHAEDYGMQVRIARFQSVFGTHGVWRGGREKAPTAISRKVALAKLNGTREVEVWGDGTAVRTFTYADDCVSGILAVMAGDYGQPLNIGSDETMSVNELVQAVSEIAGWEVKIRHVDGPVGVPGRRGCDTTLVREQAGWSAKVPVREGLARTYAWVEDKLREEAR